MNDHPLSGEYLAWLTPQIRGEEDGGSRTYGGLIALMFNTEFVELVPNDDNRIGDGTGLRIEFCHEFGVDRPDFIEDLGPCSFLEVLIALSRRLAFNAGSTPRGWAWALLRNLELDRISDPVGPTKTQRIQDILDQCIHRTYGPDGVGGFFPLAAPREDQRQVEIWYQMAAYLGELEPRR